jgi:hypothetical protein
MTKQLIETLAEVFYQEEIKNNEYFEVISKETWIELLKAEVSSCEDIMKVLKKSK